MKIYVDMKYVYFMCGKWVVDVKKVRVGRFKTKEEAIKARDEYVSKL